MDLPSDSCLCVRLLSLLTVLNHHVCVELHDWFSQGRVLCEWTSSVSQMAGRVPPPEMEGLPHGGERRLDIRPAVQRGGVQPCSTALVSSPSSGLDTCPCHLPRLVSSFSWKDPREQMAWEWPRLTQVWPVQSCELTVWSPSSPPDGFDDYGPDCNGMRVTAFLDIQARTTCLPSLICKSMFFQQSHLQLVSCAQPPCC